MRKGITTSEVPDHTAAPSALGFVYQIRYGFKYLLDQIGKGNESSVSLELLDDLSSEVEKGKLTLMQLKHHLIPANLSDRSVDLWRTLAGWSDYIREGHSLQSTQLVMITTARSHPDNASHGLTLEKREDDAILSTLLSVAEETTNATNLPFYEAFLTLQPDERMALIRAVRIVSEEPNMEQMDEAITRPLRIAFVSDGIEKAKDKLYGWWDAQAINCLLRKQLMITSSELHLKIQEIRDWFNRRIPALRFERAVPPENCAEVQPTMLYLRQLDSIKLDYESKSTAKYDFYRASRERSTWSSEQLVNIDMLDTYDSRLKEEWKIKWDIMRRKTSHSATPDEKVGAGRSVYEWVEAVADIPLRPEWSGLPRYLTRGSYHILSNRKINGKPTIGWHPDYDGLFADGDESS